MLPAFSLRPRLAHMRRYGHIQGMTAHLLGYDKILRLEGDDTIALLERLVTCRVDTLKIGDTTPGALLTPQGKVIADFDLTRTNTGCDMLVSGFAVEDLAKRLKLFRLRAAVEISIVEAPTDSVDHFKRIAECLPAFGEDFEANTVFPTDINLDQRGGVDYRKGCFVGQEVVSRMKRRGKIRKRSLLISGSGLTKGADVRAGTALLGEVTSVAGDQALARLRTDNVLKALEAGADIEVGGSPIKVDLPDFVKQELEANA